MRHFFTLFVVALFAGCVNLPPAPQIESKPGDRIGILVESGNNPTHTHIGTTVFNNFVKKYPYDWNLQVDVSNTVKNSLTTAGFVVVDLDKEGVRYSDLDRLIEANAGAWRVSAPKEAVFRKLSDDLKLKAVVVLKEGTVTAALECMGGPCSPRTADGSGLYTRSFLGLTNYFAVAAYRWNVYALNPPADMMSLRLTSQLGMPVAAIRGFKSPETFDNLTESELAPVRASVMQIVQDKTNEVIKVLNIK